MYVSTLTNLSRYRQLLLGATGYEIQLAALFVRTATMG
jgi:hypothetical protein